MDCDIHIVDRLPIPAASEIPTVAHGEANGLVGAAVTIASTRPPPDWWRVLQSPETADDWLPEEIGIRRSERLGPTAVYQAVDISVLFGAFHFARQSVVNIEWLEHGDRLKSCWIADAPANWPATQAWDTGAKWQEHATGGWLVTPSGSGSVATYRVWANAETVFPALQSWAVGRTLPAMILAYAARVESLSEPTHSTVSPP